MLRCSDNPDAEGKEKIEPFVKKKLAQNSTKHITQDKAFLWMKWSLAGPVGGNIKMHNASNPKRYHVKVFGLVDSTTSFTINLLIYFSKETSYSADLNNSNSQAVKVFEYLLRPLSTKGHHIFATRYYT